MDSKIKYHNYLYNTIAIKLLVYCEKLQAT